jgi:tetratricopeptide (TPR) repeat protein
VTVRNLVLAALLSASPRAFADAKADAKDHIQRATAAHAAGHFDEALKELTLAYALDPNPELLFAIGQVHMKLGDCTSATTFYERFIATKPDAKEAAIAQKAIASCKDHPREAAVEPPKDEPKVEPKVEPKTEPEPPPPPAPPPPQGRPWYRDTIGDVLVGLGVAAGAVAGIEYGRARTSRDDADVAPTYGDYQRLLDDSHDERNLAIGIGAGAGVLVVAGVIHYLVTGGPPEENVALVPARGGELVTWTTRF